MNSRNSTDVIVVGGGIAGLAAARAIVRAGHSVTLIEQDDQLGGRVRTDAVDGFLLDRGFQVLLSSYKQLNQELARERITLHPFEPGAQIRFKGTFYKIANPLLAPHYIRASINAPGLSLRDLLALARSYWGAPPKPELSSAEYLERVGFSAEFINSFLRPFFSGVLLSADLAVSAWMLHYTLKHFGRGYATIPEGGMQQIARALAQPLPQTSLRLGAAARKIDPNSVILESGEQLNAGAVIVSAGAGAAALLPEAPAVRWLRAVTYYFAVNKPLLPGPWLVLNGDGTGPITHLCHPSSVWSGYAPEGRSLLSVSAVVADGERAPSASDIRGQLREWFAGAGAAAAPIATYDIPEAIPFLAEPPGLHRYQQQGAGILYAGDTAYIPSLEGAFTSGVDAAAAALMHKHCPVSSR